MRSDEVVGWAVVRSAGRVAAWAWPRDAPAGVRSPVGAGFQATVVGLVGDRLVAAGNAIAWPVGLRCDGRDVAVTPRSLQQAWPAATGRIVVMLAGLFETEHTWRYGAQRWWDADDATLVARLSADGWTPVEVRCP